MDEELTWKFKVTLSDLPAGGAEFELMPDDAVRDELARHAGVVAVPSLVARLHVRPEGRAEAVVEGTLQATVRQVCVVSLEPFDNPLQESISLRFAPAETPQHDGPQVIEVDGEDPPEPIIDGKLDLAAVVAEFLTLAVDPYPRRPGVEFAPSEGGGAGEESTPFAALAKLKPGRKQ